MRWEDAEPSDEVEKSIPPSGDDVRCYAKWKWQKMEPLVPMRPRLAEVPSIDSPCDGK